MTTLGWALYLLALALAFWFWRRVRGLSFEDILDRSAHEHHRVMAVFSRHPHGGNWREYRQWEKDSAS